MRCTDRVRTAKVLAEYSVTCYMTVCILEIDEAESIVKHAFSDGVTLSNISVSAIKWDRSGRPCFIKMGTTYYLSEFIKIENVVLPIKL